MLPMRKSTKILGSLLLIRQSAATSLRIAGHLKINPATSAKFCRQAIRFASTCRSAATLPNPSINYPEVSVNEKMTKEENGTAADLLSPDSIKEYSVSLPWGDLAIKQWGPEDGHPVLALHGWQDNAGTFDNLAPLLPANIRLICLDFAGHGFSSHYAPGMIYYYWDHLVHVKMVSDKLSLPKFSILGHSLGGTVALLFASLFPDRIERIATIDILKPISVPPEAQPDKSVQSITVYQQLMGKLNGEVPSYTFEEARDRLIKGNAGSIDEAAAEVLMRRGVRKNEMGGYYYSRDIRHVIPSIAYYTNAQHREYLSRIRCPLLVMKAKDGPYYEPKETYEEFVEMYSKLNKDFQYIEVEGTHHAHLTNPHGVAPHVAKFFSKNK